MIATRPEDQDNFDDLFLRTSRQEIARKRPRRQMPIEHSLKPTRLHMNQTITRPSLNCLRDLERRSLWYSSSRKRLTYAVDGSRGTFRRHQSE
ncbi:nwd2 [Moniliophthora roreri]|nr:nwd2 [Moniliophthora roreri]